MNKRTKNIIILLVVLALVVVAVTVIPGLLGGEEEAPGDTSISLALDADALSTLSWDYNGESVSLVRGADGSWQYAEDPIFPLNQSYPQAMLAALGGLTAVSKLENPNGLADYGLENPAQVISAASSAGESTAISVGDQNAVNSSYYAMLSGDDSIYMIDDSLPSAFSFALMDLVQMETIDTIDRVSGFTITQGETSLEVVYIEGESDDTFWFAVDGGELLPLDNNEGAGLKSNISAIAWQACADYNADATELSAYGLDEPVTISLRYYTTADNYAEERSVTYELGDTAGEHRYAKLADSGMVYLISEATVQKILSVNYESLKLQA